MQPLVCIVLATPASLEMLCKYGQLLSFIDGAHNWGLAGLIVTSIIVAHEDTGPVFHLYSLPFQMICHPLTFKKITAHLVRDCL